MKIKKTLNTLLAIALLASTASVSAAENFKDWLLTFDRQKGVAPVNDEVYNEECGACHFPYQPGWLPAASWKKLLSADALADHFGDSAEMDEKTRQHILDLAMNMSAEKSYYKRSKKTMASLKEGDAPLRITETPYIHDKHENLDSKLVKDNPKVKSLSFCSKCHQKAEKGVFDDDTVVIPGHGTYTW